MVTVLEITGACLSSTAESSVLYIFTASSVETNDSVVVKPDFSISSSKASRSIPFIFLYVISFLTVFGLGPGSTQCIQW